MSVKIFWQPQSFSLVQIGQKHLVDISDGDTPNILMNVRMLSIDTPEMSTMHLMQAEMAGHFTALTSSIHSGPSPWTGWIHRCCADISSAHVYGPLGYVLFKPWNRLFLWAADASSRWQASTSSPLAQSPELESMLKQPLEASSSAKSRRP